jgi:hypothetical protein
VHAAALSCRVIRPFIRAVFCQVSRPERLPSCPARAKCVATHIAAAPLPRPNASHCLPQDGAAVIAGTEHMHDPW